MSDFSVFKNAFSAIGGIASPLLRKKLERHTFVIAALKGSGFDLLQNDFDSLYAHALVEYLADSLDMDESNGKHKELWFSYFSLSEVRDILKKYVAQEDSEERNRLLEDNLYTGKTDVHLLLKNENRQANHLFTECKKLNGYYQKQLQEIIKKDPTQLKQTELSQEILSLIKEIQKELLEIQKTSSGNYKIQFAGESIEASLEELNTGLQKLREDNREMLLAIKEFSEKKPELAELKQVAEKIYNIGNAGIVNLHGKIQNIIIENANIIFNSESGENNSKEKPFYVPIPKNPFFTGRKDVLAKLHESLCEHKKIVVKSAPKAMALSGMGGVGKTQTVAEYAYTYQNEYSAVLWVLADGVNLLRQNFGQLVKVLGLPGEKLNEQIEEVQYWLRKNKNWLLIFDNAETKDILDEAKNLIPTSGNGHVLFTTRAQATGLIQAITVDCFDEETGSIFLLRRAKIIEVEVQEHEVQSNVPEEEWKLSNTLVKELGGLALAIDQAGAYIEQTGCGIDGYLSRFENNAVDMLKIRGAEISKEHPEAVYRTFIIALENVEKHSELAGEILRDIALLHPDGIPEILYNDINPLDLDKALATLKDYSLIQRVVGRKIFTVHRLVQIVIKDTCNG